MHIASSITVNILRFCQFLLCLCCNYHLNSTPIKGIPISKRLFALSESFSLICHIRRYLLVILVIKENKTNARSKPCVILILRAFLRISETLKEESLTHGISFSLHPNVYWSWVLNYMSKLLEKKLYVLHTFNLFLY